MRLRKRRREERGDRVAFGTRGRWGIEMGREKVVDG
jgi:hypothetical protein